jgi:O-antigen/teichoic acid export membrane protein
LASSINPFDQIILYRKATQLLVVLTSSVAIIFLYYSSGVIYLWSGNSQLLEQVAPLLSILVVGSLFNSLSYLPYQLQIARGQIKGLFKIYLVIVLLFITFIIFVIPEYGVMGAAWVWLLVNGMYFFVVTYFTHKNFLSNLSLNWFIEDMLLPGFGALIVAFLAHYLQPKGYSNRLTWACFLAFTGILAIFLSTLCTKLLRNELLKILKFNKNE